MLRVGLTGGLASGKSYVGRTLADLGCHWIKADELGHQVLEPGGEAFDPAVMEFGRGILTGDGRIDRRRLGDMVFGRPDRLAKLNSIVHPPVIRLEEKLIAKIAVEDPNGIVVVEAAILVETGGYQRFDRLIVTHCRREQQIERALRRPGATREQVMARLERQSSLEEKLRVADYTVDTSGEKGDTVRQVQQIYESLRSISS